MVAVPAAASVSPVHWIVLPATATAPEAELTQPAPAVVRGAVQPAGTTMLTSPPEIPPVAAGEGEGVGRPPAPAAAGVVGGGSGPPPAAAVAGGGAGGRPAGRHDDIDLAAGDPTGRGGEGEGDRLTARRVGDVRDARGERAGSVGGVDVDRRARTDRTQPAAGRRLLGGRPGR